MNHALDIIPRGSRVMLTGASVAVIGLAIAVTPHHAIAGSPTGECARINQAQGAPQNVINNAAGGGGAPQSVINQAGGGGGVPQNILNNASAKGPHAGEMQGAGGARIQNPSLNCN